MRQMLENAVEREDEVRKVCRNRQAEDSARTLACGRRASKELKTFDALEKWCEKMNTYTVRSPHRQQSGSRSIHPLLGLGSSHHWP